MARRVTQKGRRRPKDDEGHMLSSGGPGQAPHAPVRPKAQQYHNVGGQAILPTELEVLASIRSLYLDELKPFGRILRKRIAEQAAELSGATAPGQIPTSLPDVDIRRLREVCEESKEIAVNEEDGGDWSALLSSYPDRFVNVYSPQDVYPPELWDQASAYFSSLGENELCLPGGRYACAQALMARNIPFLSDRSLGQICHIVQLAISQKRILGYYCGAVVPYSRSQSMVKEWCAFKGAPCTPTVNSSVPVTSKLRMATWDMVREHMQSILQSAASPGKPGSVPLSNVKRLFRSRYQTELSETMLGHSKLSELLQDPRLHDVCTVQLQGHGYLVLQNQSPDGKPRVAPAQGGYPGSLPQPTRPQRKLNAPLEASLKNAATLAFARAQGADQGAQRGGDEIQTDATNTDWRERLLEEMITSGGQFGAAAGHEDVQQKIPRQPWRVDIGSDSPLRGLSPNRRPNPVKYVASDASSVVDESVSPVKAAKPWMLWPETPDTSPDALQRFYRRCPEDRALMSGYHTQSGLPGLNDIHSKQPQYMPGPSSTRQAKQLEAVPPAFEYEGRAPWPANTNEQGKVPVQPWDEDMPMKVPMASGEANSERRGLDMSYGGRMHGYMDTPSMSPERPPSRFTQFMFPDGPPQEEAEEDCVGQEGNNALLGHPSTQQMRGDYSPNRRKLSQSGGAGAGAKQVYEHC